LKRFFGFPGFLKVFHLTLALNPLLGGEFLKINIMQICLIPKILFRQHKKARKHLLKMLSGFFANFLKAQSSRLQAHGFRLTAQLPQIHEYAIKLRNFQWSYRAFRRRFRFQNNRLRLHYHPRLAEEA
jgi:hypothetical protein